MERYKLITKGVFERAVKFEEKLNALASQGWRVVSSGADNGQIYVIMERER
jgi:hypothetical protein